MLIFLTILISISVLVFVHEFGHFIMAKRAGMRVEEFGFGFPPKIFGFKYGETTYTINLIPLGGFVKIFGEDGSGTKDPRSFAFGSFWSKTKVLLAGVVMNVLLAFVLLSIANYVGLRASAAGSEDLATVRDLKIHILQIAPAHLTTSYLFNNNNKLPSAIQRNKRKGIYNSKSNL